MKQFAAIACVCLSFLPSAWAHQASVSYLANEAVLVTSGDKKVLFDPFFHEAFGTYQLVPEPIKQAVFAGESPYNDITAIVISHAHGDHFAADDVLSYLTQYPNTKLIAPQQATKQLTDLQGAQAIQQQVHSVQLSFNQSPVVKVISGLTFEAVRIPHAGWPGRAEIENIVFRVTFPHPKTPVTVMHLGDADSNDDHYLPFKAHWQRVKTNTAFPPYWFYFSAEGNDILSSILNVENSVGIHVPIDIPARLKSSGKDYFSKPGESRMILPTHKH